MRQKTGKQPSRLAALRIAREQREAPIREPLERELKLISQMMREARASQRVLERFIGSDIGQHVIKNIGAHMSRGIRQKIVEAIMAATPNGMGRPELIELHLSSGEIAWLDPSSIERRALDAWKEQALPRLRLSVDASSAHTIMDIRIPEFGYRQSVAMP